MKRIVLGSLLATCVAHSGVGHAAASGWSYAIPASASSYYDSAHQTEYVFYVDASGYTQALEHPPGGPWKIVQIANYTATDPCAFGTTMTAYFDGTEGHLFCLASNDDLLEFAGNPPAFHADITSSTGVDAPSGGKPQGYSVCNPLFCTYSYGLLSPATLAGYFVPAGHPNAGAHVFYMSRDGSMHDAHYDTSWHDGPIEGPGSPYDPEQTDVGEGMGLAALWDGSVGHVYYVSFQGDFIQYYNNGSWWNTTLAAPGGDVPSSFIAASSTANEYQTVYAAPSTGRNAYVYTFVPGSGWTTSVQTQAKIAATSPNVTYSAGGADQYFYVGATDHVFDGVSGLDVTTYLSALNVNYDTNLPQPVSGFPYVGFGGLTGFWDGSCRHLFYVATDSHVHEMYSCATSGTSWHEHDLMPTPNAPAAD